MKEIIVFVEEEVELIERILKFLYKEDKSDEIINLKHNRVSLQELANSISLYPSILKEQHLGSAKRSVETLVNSLCQEKELDLRFHMPTKALLGNAFLIAKINFFFMLFYLTNDMPELEDVRELLKTVITNIVFTLMAEEVFLSIIDDMVVSKTIRLNAAYLLAKIWEYRLDHGVKEFSPILSSIWRARRVLTPTFGTMLGFSELFKISESIEPAFFDFLQRDSLTDREIEAIEEFIFGLSYEEIKKLRNEMEIQGKPVISKQDVERIIGDNRVYPDYNISDPRELYRSFRDRKLNARFRAKSKLLGPQKTIEEYIMCFLLSVTDVISNWSKSMW